MRWIGLFLGLAVTAWAFAALAGETVHVRNLSKPTRCAEEDNLTVEFVKPGIRHFAIEARPPAYLGTLQQDKIAPDFSACDMSHDPSFAFAWKDVVLFEDKDYALVGHTYPTFWRPGGVDFKVGDTITHDLHLVQLIRKIGRKRIEILVLYPPDGYWRAKPLPPPSVADTAYGSSFLIGPIEQDGRPYVPLSSVEFRRRDLSFHLGLRTGMGSLRVTDSSPKRTRLAVTLPPSDSAFTALRSMYVTPQMADATEVTLMSPQGGGRMHILDFKDAQSASVNFGRSLPSNHNTSAPDLWFGDFRR